MGLEEESPESLSSNSTKKYKRSDSFTPLQRLDRYFRREDTALAWLARLISPKRGPEYLDRHQNKAKRYLDLSVTIPAAIVCLPGLMALGIATRLSDGENAFYVQERVVPGWARWSETARQVLLFKIRTMQVNADQHPQGIMTAFDLPAEQDPRNTALGSHLRRFNLDELPQIYQVLCNQLTMVGLRSATLDDFYLLADAWSKHRFQNWKNDLYRIAGDGVTGERQTMGTKNKNLFVRYHPDAHYVANASLGLDLYLLWRTAARALGKL